MYFFEVHGEWSNWSDWSACPVTCGLGMQKRHRNCSNPYPMLYGDHCFGDSVEYKNCVEKMCNGKFITIYLFIYLFCSLLSFSKFTEHNFNSYKLYKAF
jgi:hypothetical protein